LDFEKILSLQGQGSKYPYRPLISIVPSFPCSIVPSFYHYNNQSLINNHHHHHHHHQTKIPQIRKILSNLNSSPLFMGACPKKMNDFLNEKNLSFLPSLQSFFLVSTTKFEKNANIKKITAYLKSQPQNRGGSHW
jgi:hypothetical protein